MNRTPDQGSVRKIFKSLYDQAKSLDPTRPVTLVSDIGVNEEALEFLDIICLNRYLRLVHRTGTT